MRPYELQLLKNDGVATCYRQIEGRGDDMDKLFDLDSPIMQALTRIANMMILNVLVIVSSLPIITIGAAQTALYYATWKNQNNEGYIWKDYWFAFRSNFKQATALWSIFLGAGVIGFIVMLVHTYTRSQMSSIGMLLISAMSLLCMGACAWVFPLQSRFQNTVIVTLRNAIRCSIIALPRTIIMSVLNALPVILYFGVPELFVWFSPMLLIVWFALVASINSLLTKKFFNLNRTEENSHEPKDV